MSPSLKLPGILLFLVIAPMLVVSGDAAAATHKRPRHATRHAATVVPAVPPRVDANAIAPDARPVATEFDRWIGRLEGSGQVSGLAVAVIKDDQVLLERSIGYADWSSGEAIGPDTVFRLASLSKAFATTLTGLLVRDGTMGWDTRIAEVLPTFTLANVDSSRKLTVGDILSHRVGLPHNTYDNLLEQDQPYPLLVERLGEVPIACPPGECYAYQNIAFSLIGDVTYALTGDFFSHEVEKRIFHPLGMRTATYGRDALEDSEHWARPHRRAPHGWTAFMPNETYYRMPPAAGVNASLRDMEQWLIAQMGGRPEVLSAELLDTLHAPLIDTPHDLRSSPWRRGRLLDAHYALGWRVYQYSGEPLVFHAGAVQGYRAMIGFLPKRRFGLIMLWNCESAAPSGLMPMLFDRYLGLPAVDWAGLGPDNQHISSGGDIE
ncbi:serine hydrolase domain-containing protein [Dokdonella sp.]|uniref:serine hydrolase domain-containing protein n=1 Tax=Dokdonella sp. TaxID=2291710 RepID=UPI002CCF5DFA|nr:serine hydrolase domain-containing protein [Dokdonella sp.]HOX70855.1 serine hydrolase domain-containing protein [Dokdonella sp.]HPN79087.1 serine hydrolase domain-containing protein [Dokdonella sp.]